MSTRAGSRVSTASRAVMIGLLIVSAVRLGDAQTTGYFFPTDAMSGPREAVATAILESGAVLLAGQNALSPAAELYDPVTERFTAAGSLIEARSDAAAVRLADGRVLIVGGSNGAHALSSAELYDPSSSTFTTAGNMSTPRVRPAIARLLDGRVLIAGGHDGTTTYASAELYDPATGVFGPTGSMSAARVGTATVLPNGTVLMIGSELGSAAASVELYDPAQDGFRATGGLNVARHDHAATLLADGRVLVSGGLADGGNPLAEAELYDAADGTFRLAGRMVGARHQHAAVLLADGSVLVVGGHDYTGPLSTAERYDVDTAAFNAEAPLAEERAAPLIAALPDGGALVAGGRGSSHALATAERYWREDGRHETSTVVASSTASSTYGQPVTYTATVRSDAGIPGGRVQFFEDASLVGEANLNDGRATLTTSTTPAGTRQITAAYLGSVEFKRSESAPVEQVIAKAAGMGSLTITPIQRQYSDPVTFVATISPANAAQSVTFKLGAIVLGSAAVVGGTARFETPVLPNMPLGSRIITAVFNQDVPNYTIANVSKSMSIIKEDARIYAWGGTFYTACWDCTTAKVLLRATVKDISATPEANGDVTPGDVRNATVGFMNRATYALIATVPVTLPDPANPTIGQAWYEWTVDLGGASSKTFYIGYAVGGLYTRNTYDYVVVTVSKLK